MVDLDVVEAPAEGLVAYVDIPIAGQPWCHWSATGRKVRDCVAFLHPPVRPLGACPARNQLAFGVGVCSAASCKVNQLVEQGLALDFVDATRWH